MKFNFSNFKINLCFSPFIYLGLLTLYRQLPDVVVYGEQSPQVLALYGTLLYCWCSRFFQPDLDHETNRPGETSFPVGEIACKASYNFLKAIFTGMIGQKKGIPLADRITYFPVKAIAKLWFYYWAPYANLFTHRGLSHWPVIGTLSRIFYLHATLLLITPLIPQAQKGIEILRHFYFWGKMGPEFYLFALPVYLCDIVHSAGDYVESKIKGLTFCPPQVKRGLISKVLRITI